MSYNNPTPVAVALIPVQRGQDIYLLGVRRNIEPFVGEVCLPGGYIDQGESVKVAGVREVKEETGLVLPSDNMFLFDDVITERNQLLLFTIFGNPVDYESIDWSFTSGETQGLVLISLNTTDICFPLHQEAVNKFFTE